MADYVGRLIVDARLGNDRHADVQTEVELNDATAVDITDMCCTAAAAALTVVYADMLAGGAKQGITDSLDARKAVLRHLLPPVGHAFFIQMDENLGAGATIH